MFNHKTKRTFAMIIAVVLIIAMVVPLIMAAFQ